MGERHRERERAFLSREPDSVAPQGGGGELHAGLDLRTPIMT